MITYTQVRSDRRYEATVCGYRYVTLVGTCRRHYPLPRERAILKIEKHLSCNTRGNGTGSILGPRLKIS